MSRSPELSVLALCALLAAGAAEAQSFGLGRPATPDEVAAWDIDVRPDGLGLPEGSGSVADGEALYEAACAACHGYFGEGEGRWPKLAGGQGTLTHEDPEKTIGSYWPYVSTVFDYVNRAMPYGNARSLSADEVYAITAYLLFLNDLVDDDFVLSRENLTDVRLPNEDGFVFDPRAELPSAQVREVCMENCLPEVRIVMRASVLDVTPEAHAMRAQPVPWMPEESGDGAEGETVAAVGTASEAPAPEAAADLPDPALIARGERAFRACAACHQIGAGAQHRTGPHLNGIFGAPAGRHGDFSYSRAMRQAAEQGLVWDAATLDAYLARPRDVVPGTSMGFAGMRSEQDRAAVIAYLEGFAE